MSVKSKESLRTYWNNNLNTNGANSITGEKLNNGGNDLIDSTMPRTYQFPMSGSWNLDGYSQELLYDGGFVIWNDSSDGTLTLGDALYNGASFKVLNSGSAVLNLSATTIIGNTSIKAGEYAIIEKMNTDYWMCQVLNSSDSLEFYGTKYVNGTGIVINPTAGTWIEIPLPASYGTQLLKNVTDVPNNRLKLGSIGSNVKTSIGGSISVNLASNSGGRMLLLGYMINGSVPISATNTASESSIGATSTTIYIPMQLSTYDMLNAGDEVSLAVYSNTNDPININRVSLTIN